MSTAQIIECWENGVEPYVLRDRHKAADTQTKRVLEPLGPQEKAILKAYRRLYEAITS
jgi:hypothetical protein